MPDGKLPKEKAQPKPETLAGKSPEKIKEELQKKSMQFQLLQAELQIIRERQHELSHRMSELSETKQAIEDIKTAKEGSELLMPLGSGNFISGKVSDTGKILVGIGGGIAVKKSPDEAAAFLEERLAEASSALQELEKQYMAIEVELHRRKSEIK